MYIIFFLITVSFGMALLFLGFFFWAYRDGQFEDTQTPSMRVLFEEEKRESSDATTLKEGVV